MDRITCPNACPLFRDFAVHVLYNTQHNSEIIITFLFLSCSTPSHPHPLPSHTLTPSQGMSVLLRNAVTVMDSSVNSDLFASGATTAELQRQAVTEYLCRDVFYGRLLGFQVLVQYYVPKSHFPSTFLTSE